MNKEKSKNVYLQVPRDARTEINYPVKKSGKLTVKREGPGAEVTFRFYELKEVKPSVKLGATDKQITIDVAPNVVVFVAQTTERTERLQWPRKKTP